MENTHVQQKEKVHYDILSTNKLADYRGIKEMPQGWAEVWEYNGQTYWFYIESDGAISQKEQSKYLN